MKALFNGHCVCCKGFRPRCANVQLYRRVLHLPGRTTIVLCADCRRLEEVRGRYLVDARHREPKS